MNVLEELCAWADKHGVRYRIRKYDDIMVYMDFVDSQTYSDAIFSYNNKTGDFAWYGGD